MIDFVLRGFCKKCEESVIMTHVGAAPHQYSVYDAECGLSEPVWFLSAKQMKIVWEDDRSRAWMFERVNKQHRASAHFLLYHILDENPFLVAKILKHAGEKNSKEENK